jgi:hypothetical protein
MDKKSRVLIGMSIIAVLISAGVLYRNTMVLHRFEIIQNDDGVPEVEE